MSTESHHRYAITSAFLTTSLALLAVSAQPTSGQVSPRQEAAIADTILELAETFNAAWQRLDPDEILEFYGDDLQYYWMGTRMPSREAFARLLREDILSRTRSYSTDVVAPSVQVLGPDAAAVGFTARGEAERATGERTPVEVAVSLTFARRNGQWKIVHMHESGRVPRAPAAGAPPGAAANEDAPTAADSAAIMTAMANWERGWDVYDSELATRDYAADADWTNAFGTRLIGRDSIRTYLTRAFTRPALAAGSTRYEYHDLRFLAPDVALLRSRAIREGQQLADGSSPPRHINHLRVFIRRDGTWQIVSHLIGDERTPGQPR